MKRKPQHAVRTLTLLRHAKSSWKYPELDDMERPLNKRGRRDAKAMASRIVAHGAKFSHVVSSPARRTRETLLRMLLTLPAQNATITFDKTFYIFELDALLDALKHLPKDLRDVLVVGHNPALEDTITYLTGEPIDGFPTAACARMTFNLPGWSELHEGCADLVWLLRPEKP